MSEKVLVLRTATSDGRSHGGFVWPESGPVSCTDWDPTPECGGGLHGLLWGEGDGGLLDWSETARWLVVETPAESIVDLGGKVKFPAGEVVYCGDRAGAVECIERDPEARARAVTAATRTAGDEGTATAGYRGTATAGDWGTATAGYRGTATAGDWGTATAGDWGVLVILHFDAIKARYTLKAAEVGEDGIEANVAYRLDPEGRFVKADQ